MAPLLRGAIKQEEEHLTVLREDVVNVLDAQEQVVHLETVGFCGLSLQRPGASDPLLNLLLALPVLEVCVGEGRERGGKTMSEDSITGFERKKFGGSQCCEK